MTLIGDIQPCLGIQYGTGKGTQFVLARIYRSLHNQKQKDHCSFLKQQSPATFVLEQKKKYRSNKINISFLFTLPSIVCLMS
jgi:hypothetical protein